MPTIIGQEEQQNALRTINTLLKDASVVNKFLSAKNPSATYSISFPGADGKRVSCKLVVKSKDDMDTLALTYKDQIKSEIFSLAEKYNIALDHEDQMILDDILVSSQEDDLEDPLDESPEEPSENDPRRDIPEELPEVPSDDDPRYIL